SCSILSSLSLSSSADPLDLHSFPTRRSSDLLQDLRDLSRRVNSNRLNGIDAEILTPQQIKALEPAINISPSARYPILGASLQRRSEEHTSELQSRSDLVCRLLLEKKKRRPCP